jgi:hypothetical protein
VASPVFPPWFLAWHLTVPFCWSLPTFSTIYTQMSSLYTVEVPFYWALPTNSTTTHTKMSSLLGSALLLVHSNFLHHLHTYAVITCQCPSDGPFQPSPAPTYKCRHYLTVPFCWYLQTFSTSYKQMSSLLRSALLLVPSNFLHHLHTNFVITWKCPSDGPFQPSRPPTHKCRHYMQMSSSLGSANSGPIQPSPLLTRDCHLTWQCPSAGPFQHYSPPKHKCRHSAGPLQLFPPPTHKSHHHLEEPFCWSLPTFSTTYTQMSSLRGSALLTVPSNFFHHLHTNVVITWQCPSAGPFQLSPPPTHKCRHYLAVPFCWSLPTFFTTYIQMLSLLGSALLMVPSNFFHHLHTNVVFTWQCHSASPFQPSQSATYKCCHYFRAPSDGTSNILY